MITKIILTLLVFGIVFYGLRFLKKINFNNNYEAKKDEKVVDLEKDPNDMGKEIKALLGHMNREKEKKS